MATGHYAEQAGDLARAYGNYQREGIILSEPGKASPMTHRGTARPETKPQNAPDHRVDLSVSDGEVRRPTCPDFLGTSTRPDRIPSHRASPGSRAARWATA